MEKNNMKTAKNVYQTIQNTKNVTFGVFKINNLRSKFLGLCLSLIFLFSSCTTYKLERQLSPKFKEWYELHSMLMETKIPWYLNVVGYEKDGTAICSTKVPVEKIYFLKLSDQLKRKYIKVFWDIRRPGVGEIFYARLSYINRVFDNEGIVGWKTDRGKIALLCGFPDVEQYYYNNEPTIFPGELLNERYRLIWMYYQNQRYAMYVFCYQFPVAWKICVDKSLREMSTQMELEKYWRKFFAPTESGWSNWASELIEE